MIKVDFSRSHVIGGILFLLMLLLTPIMNLVSAFFAYEEWYLLDEGAIAYAASRIASGEYPHRDFVYYYAGGFEIILGQIFRALGNDLLVARWMLGFAMAVTTLLVYQLIVKLRVDEITAVVVAVVPVVIGYGMNFHIYPAWFAGVCILAAVLIFLNGIERTRSPLIIIAGICLGLATVIKQNTGILALLGFLFCLGSMNGKDQENTKRGVRHWKLANYFILTLPMIVFGIEVYLVSSQLSLINVIMFLSWPAVIAGIVFREMSRLIKSGESSFRPFFTSTRNLLLGFFIGLMPLAVFFLVKGGIAEFVSEAFLTPHDQFAKRYSVFKFVDETPLVFLRRLAMYLVPLGASVVGLSFSFRSLNRRSFDVGELGLLLSALILSTLFFTLYPIANRVYVLYMLPLVAIPAAFVIDKTVKGIASRRLTRGVIVLCIPLIVGAAYLGLRKSAGDFGKMASLRIELLNSARGEVYVPAEVAGYINPVLTYLSHRPADEKYVAFDVYNKALGFLTGRQTVIDYLQKHYYGELDESDVLRLMQVADERQVETIILGKKYLDSTPAFSSLFAYLEAHYVLVLDTSDHLVYQRAS